jgi:glycosyltransferase involved in cell wall biosynthesis
MCLVGQSRNDARWICHRVLLFVDELLPFAHMNRVLIFSTTYFPLVGGAEVAMKEITDRLPGWQFDLVCARLQPGLETTERIGNVTIHRCGFGNGLDKFLLPLLGVWRACRLVKEGDRIPIWSLMASYGGFAALAYTWVRPKTRFLLTLQEGDPLEHYAKRAGRLNFLHKKIFRRANAVQAISQFLARWATDMGFRGTPTVVPNGVDYAKFARRISAEARAEQRRFMGYDASDTVIVTASRLSKKNAVDDLIRAIALLPETYKLLVAGVGEDEAMLRSLVSEVGVARRVQFLGKKTHEELPALLQSSDLFCRPSLSEGLGNAFLEAMAAGIPVIATPVGGIPDFLEDGETGVFCQPHDPASIAAAAQRIQQDAALREKILVQADALVRDRYDWDGIARRMGDLLASIAQT